MTIAISLERITDCVFAHSSLEGLRTSRPAILSRDNAPAIKRLALDSLATIIADTGLEIKKTNIDSIDPATDDIVSFEIDSRQSDGRITLLRANIEATTVCAVLEQANATDTNAGQWCSRLRQKSALTLPPPIKRAI